MWKSSNEESRPDAPGAPPTRERSAAPTSGKHVASLGPSLVIRGTLSGQEDLVIEGQVEGEISLRKHSVTVGPKGRVKADIFSKSICVEGEVHGNIFGDEQVTIRRSGKVKGNVTSPRVSLEDGSKFKGAIDMNPPPAKSAEEVTSKRPGARRQVAASPARAAEEENSHELKSRTAEG